MATCAAGAGDFAQVGMERAASAAPVVTAAFLMNCRLEVRFIMWSPLDCGAAVRLWPVPVRSKERTWMNNTEKAFTLRLYFPRKQVVKRAIAGAFPALSVARQ